MGFDYLSPGIYQSYSDTVSHWDLANGHRSVLSPPRFPLRWKHHDIQSQEKTSTAQERRWISETAKRFDLV